MAEERTLGLVRAHEEPSEELSKEELQRRLSEARGSISNTVTEIKESVVNQVQAVKDTLDWREQFRKRPFAWTAGAAGVGFLVGYGVAAAVKGDSRNEELLFSPAESPSRSYAGQALVGATPEASMKPRTSGNGHDEDKGPGFFHRLAETPVYEKVKNEAGSIGDALIKELGNTAKLVVIPALIKSVKNFLGSHLAGVETETITQPGATMKQPRSEAKAGYQPVLEQNQS